MSAMARNALKGGGRAGPATAGLSEKLATLGGLDMAGLRDEWRPLYRAAPSACPAGASDPGDRLGSSRRRAMAG